jgi:para-nitrobenzyl esterase
VRRPFFAVRTIALLNHPHIAAVHGFETSAGVHAIVMASSIATSSRPTSRCARTGLSTVGPPRPVLDLGFTPSRMYDEFSVAPAGRFLVRRPVPGGSEAIRVIVNWPSLLKQRYPTSAQVRMTRSLRSRHALASISTAFGLCITSLLTGAQSPAGPQVRTDLGVVEGTTDAATGVGVFRGIPYAAPPAGEWRWRPPRPVTPWTDVRTATSYASVCPQPSDSTSEDCLHLNVWTPRAEPDARLPVIVFFHGGAAALGSGEMEAEHLARMGVVVVSPNFRLGFLGHLAHPALREGPSNVSGNYSLLDQIAALQWVQRNVTRFGGDAARVTIAGGSSGARAVATLVVSPLAKGLFHRAVLQSGSGMDHSVESLAAGEAKGLGAAAIVGVSGTDEVAARALRALPPGALLKPSAVFRRRAQDEGRPAPVISTAVIDGWAIPRPVDALLEEGAFHRVPILIGTNADEGSPVVARDARFASVADYHAKVARWYRDPEGILARAYPVTEGSQMLPAFERLQGDEMYGAPARAFARLTAQHGVPVYFYFFTRIGNGSRAPGAFHGAQGDFFMGLPALPGSLGRTPYDASLSRTMTGYLVAFATTGDPNGGTGGSRPLWPRFAPGSEKYLELGGEVIEKQGLRTAEWDALDRLARSHGAIRPSSSSSP